MADKSITKVSSSYAPKGPAGQKYLASGVQLSMRLWEKEHPAEDKPETVRDYETIGFVIEGKAELYIEGQRILLDSGDSWVVPKGAKHRYKILEPFTAVEVTNPPAEFPRPRRLSTREEKRKSHAKQTSSVAKAQR